MRLFNLPTLVACLASLSACAVGPADAPTDASTTADAASTANPTEPSGAESDTGLDLPPECLTPDPAVDAAFSIDLLPGDVDVIDVPCTITAVSIVAGDVVTGLDCKDGTMSVPATLTIAGAPEGPVAWAAGDAVRVIHHVMGDFSDDGHVVQMRPADDPEALLVSAVDNRYDEGIYYQFEPLALDYEPVCPRSPLDVAEVRTTFTAPDGSSVDIFSRHRDVLTGEAGWTYVIDVELADSDYLHNEANFKVLVRRVAL
jgi:hypothetical protein